MHLQPSVHLFRSLAHTVDLEPNLLKPVDIEHTSTVENESWLLHTLVDSVPVEGVELVPGSENDDGF